ncbi:hypothetical protein HYDPIDRAFT_26477 [Hydnomerulius pinastri MD-312]|nr:hypothetical protein HYDPIDRAFT_26477 [Hydnomerulius pinastri MD-312]
MGPSRKVQRLTQDEVKALLREKDDQIASLEARQEAYSARASTAHTRLLKTIDVLDALRAQHALEMSAEEQAKTGLTLEVGRWRSVAKSLEVERDELKDAVEDLIEKVQISNEWSSWPCSRMSITKHANPIAEGMVELRSAKENHNDNLLAYATSIIARLRTELDFERQNHSRTAEEANLRIEELDAKVAVREVELEACINSPSHKSEPNATFGRTTGKPISGRKVSQPKPISDEECLRFLEGNNARNRSLELEIRSIAERLEQAQMAASMQSEPDPISYPGPPETNFSLNGDRRHSTTGSEEREPNTLPATHPREMIPLAAPGDAPQPAAETSPPAPGSPSIMLSIALLDNQIRSMSAQTDVLKAERVTLVETAARQKRVASGMNMDVFPDVLRVEEECVRLSAQVSDLRGQLDYARTSANIREKELLREIEQLRSSTRPQSPRLYHVHSPQLLEDDIAAEEDMELATPLQPTTILSTRSPITSSQFADPLLIPLPFSPERVSSPIASPPPSTSRRSGQQDIERVQEALLAARAHLAEKEDLLAQLRSDVEELRRQIPFGSSQPVSQDGQG